MTKTIEFGDIRVGDRIRVTSTKIVYDGSDTKSTLLVWEIAVTAVSHEFVDSFAYCFSRDDAKRYTFELLERKVAEPTGIGAVVQFSNEVGIKRTYVRAGDCSWYNVLNGLESWAALTCRASGPIEILSEGVEL